MIKKILGIDDKSINKKSTYYTYFVGAVFGWIGVVVGIGMFVFKYSDFYKKILRFQFENIKYLTLIAEKNTDIELLNATTSCLLNLNLLNDIYVNFAIFVLVFGFTLIANFILFKELQNRKIDKNK